MSDQFAEAYLFKVELLHEWKDPHYGDENLEVEYYYFVADSERQIKQEIEIWNERKLMLGKYTFISAELLTDLVIDARHSEP